MSAFLAGLLVGIVVGLLGSVGIAKLRSLIG